MSEKENKEEKKALFLKILEMTYEKVIAGLPGVSSCEELADEYLKKNKNDKKTAARHMANVQIAKCTTSGFLTNLGGLITLPISISADLSAVWFMQLRMIATTAVMAGLNPKNDEVKALCFACLGGQGCVELAKRAGIEFSKRGGYLIIGKISGKTLTAINQKVGMRLFTKFGEKGVINLGKGVPFIGGVVGGTFDFLSTSAIASLAIKTFL